MLVSHREYVADLGANAENARPEPAEERGCAKIVCNLLVGVANQTGEELFGQKTLRAPIKMEVDAILVLCSCILEIVGEAGDP